MYHNLTAVILAGGAGKRLNGVVKGKIIIDGKEIMLRIFEVLHDLFEEIIIITNDPEAFTEYNKCNIIKDIHIGKGPIGGIHAGLTAASNEVIFVFAGDMPYLQKDLIINMIESFDVSCDKIVIPQIGDNIEPLHGIYSKSNMKILENYHENGLDNSVHGFLKKVNHRFLKIEKTEKTDRAFTNINTREDVIMLKDYTKSDL